MASKKKQSKPVKFRIVESPDGDGYNCQYCKKSNVSPTMCLEYMNGYICCRPHGHKGMHVACGGGRNSHPIITWKGTKIIEGSKYA